LPEYVNWSEAGAVSTPQNQLHCGACWAFTTAAALEALAFINGTDTEVQRYSVQQLMDCDEYNDDCAGGWMYMGYNYTRKFGIMLEEDYPMKY